MTEDKSTSDRRGILRIAGAACLGAVGFAGPAAASGKGNEKKSSRDKPPGHTKKSDGKRGNRHPGKGKSQGKKRGHKAKKKRGSRDKKKPKEGKKKRKKGKKGKKKDDHDKK